MGGFFVNTPQFGLHSISVIKSQIELAIEAFFWTSHERLDNSSMRSNGLFCFPLIKINSILHRRH